MRHYIGIDLGTTNSAICSFDGKETCVWKSPDQADVTPSAIYIDRRGHRFYGRKAFERASSDEKNAATLFKRYLGTSKEFLFADSKITMTPEECSAHLLKVLYGYLPEEIRQDPETVTIITVPSAFNQMKKDATLEAARMAGIGQIALMQEPVAAVMSVLKKDPKDQLFLIYDLGGGTFDVSVAHHVGGHVSLLAQGGREMCGGRDMDRWIYRHKILPWLRDHFSLPEDPDGDPTFLGMKRTALFAAEEAKIALSLTDQTVSIWLDEDRLATKDLQGEEMYLDLTLTREDLDETVREMADETVQLTRETMNRAGVFPDQIGQIVFIGGPSMYGPLRDEVCRLLGIKRGIAVNPMTAVAEGASIYAESIDWSDDRHRRRESIREISDQTGGRLDNAVSENGEKETGKEDEIGAEGANVNGTKSEAANADDIKSEPVNADDIKPEPASADGIRPEAANANGTKPEPAKPYTAKPADAKKSVLHPEGTKPEDTPPDQTTSPGKVTIRYESRTSEKTSRIAVIFQDDEEGFVRAIVHSNTAGSDFDSGKVPIRQRGIITVPLPALGTYPFLLEIYKDKDSEACETRFIEITRTLASVASIPASHSIAVKALDRPDGKPVPVYLIRANDPLPKSGTTTFRAAKQLVGGSSDYLSFSLWEGEIPDPIDDNRYIGTYKIPGAVVPDAIIPVGAEILCDYEINEAGTLRLGVSIPCVDVQVKGKNFYSRMEGQINLNDTSALVKEVNQLLVRTAQMKLSIVDDELDQVRLLLQELHHTFIHSKDPEAIAEGESRLMDCYRRVARLHQRYANVIRSRDLKQTISRFHQYEDKATEDEKADFWNLVDLARFSIDMGSSDFDSQMKEMSQIIAVIMWRQDDLIRKTFSNLILFPGDYYERAEFDRLKAEGLTCLENGDMAGLRDVVNNLYKIRKEDRKIDPEKMLDDIGVYRS